MKRPWARVMKEVVQRERKVKVSFREIPRLVKEEVTFLKEVLSDPRTPRASKWLLSLALSYALSPMDLIPDFIPIVGHLDDLIVIPALVFLALRMVPREIIVEHQKRELFPPGCRSQARNLPWAL